MNTVISSKELYDAHKMYVNRVERARNAFSRVARFESAAVSNYYRAKESGDIFEKRDARRVLTNTELERAGAKEGLDSARAAHTLHDQYVEAVYEANLGEYQTEALRFAELAGVAIEGWSSDQ